MTPLQTFEVTKLIDLALDRLTSETRGRDFAYCIAMVTQNVLECMQQMTARIQAVDQWKKKTNFKAAPQTKNDWIFCFSPWNVTFFTQDHVSLALEKVLR